MPVQHGPFGHRLLVEAVGALVGHLDGDVTRAHLVVVGLLDGGTRALQRLGARGRAPARPSVSGRGAGLSSGSPFSNMARAGSDPSRWMRSTISMPISGCSSLGS